MHVWSPNPGCYPTTILPPLVPLIKAGLIALQDIIIMSSFGVGGPGRSEKEVNVYPRWSEGIFSYGITRHRHVPEIEQELSNATSSKVTVSFTPTITQMRRGIMSTINVNMAPRDSVEDLKHHLKGFYEGEDFVVVLSGDQAPETKDVQDSNGCHINVFPDRVRGKAVIICVVDYLVKEAFGQAIQNLNLMLGIPENTGLTIKHLFH